MVSTSTSPAAHPGPPPDGIAPRLHASTGDRLLAPAAPARAVRQLPPGVLDPAGGRRGPTAQAGIRFVKCPCPIGSSARRVQVLLEHFEATTRGSAVVGRTHARVL